MKMVMIFASKKARNFLLENGFVFTFRKTRRKRTGNDWINAGYRKSKITDVNITEFGKYFPGELGIFAPFSGFELLGNWILEIAKLNKDKIPESGYLYFVEIR